MVTLSECKNQKTYFVDSDLDLGHLADAFTKQRLQPFIQIIHSGGNHASIDPRTH